MENSSYSPIVSLRQGLSKHQNPVTSWAKTVLRLYTLGKHVIKNCMIATYSCRMLSCLYFVGLKKKKKPISNYG